MPDSIAVLQVRLGPTVRAGEEEETDKHRLLWRLVQFLRAQGKNSAGSSFVQKRAECLVVPKPGGKFDLLVSFAW